MHLRRFELIPLLFMAFSVLLLSGLGIWQLQRLQWKNDLLSRIEQAQAAPVLGSLPALPGQPAIDALAFNKVSLSGTYLYDKTLHMVGRPKEAGMSSANGFFMLTPFKLDDDGRVILVNRGFSLLGKETKPEGIQTVTGVIRPLRIRRMFAPDNNPQKNVWFYEDIPAMSEATGLQILPLVVEATGPSEKGVYPIPHSGKIIMRNDHLYYAITWFSIAIIGIIMFILYHREPSSKKP